MEYIEFSALVFTIFFANYIFAEWNILVGKTYLGMFQDKKINRKRWKFFLIETCYFCLWPMRTPECDPIGRHYLWQCNEPFYLLIMTIAGSTLKIIGNFILIFGGFIVLGFYMLFFTNYIIPIVTNEEAL